jgi:hypothetical protein
LGVCVHGDNVLDVGDWDVGDSGPFLDYSPWLKKCASKAEKAYAKRIGPEIEATREAAIPAPPPVMQLLQALWMGDMAGAKKLRDQGIDINDVPAGMPPPLFAAIESMNIEHVRMALELGAKTDVRNHQGQSPLQFAEELLANYKYAHTMQERELAGLDQLAASPEGTPPQPGTLLSGMQAFRAMASQLLGQMGEAMPGPVEMPRETVSYHRQRYEQLVKDSRQGQESLAEIIRLLKEVVGRQM